MSKQKILSSILTVFVIAVLLIATPAQAIQLNLGGLPSNGAVNSEVSFSLKTQIDAGENIPIDDVTLKINGPDGEQTCVFDADGTLVSGCDNLQITLIQDTTDYVSSPNRYGNGWNGSEDLNTTFGYGYGFGNGPVMPTLLEWQVIWNTTGKPTGDYNIDFFLASSGNSEARKYRLETPGVITLGGTPSVSVDIKSPFPIGNNYVFLCNAGNFTPTSYDWNFGDGQTNYDRPVSDVYHTFTNPGTYLVTCVANDGVNNVVGTRLVTVGGGAPNVSASADLYVKSGFPIDNNYVLVCNSSVANARYDWVFGDGQKSLNISNSNVYHTYAPGQYNATCTAKNGTASASDSLAINATAPVPPPVSATLAPKAGWPIGNSYVLVCNVTGFTPVSYDWVYGDGQKSLNIANQNTFHTYAPGDYNASCTGKNGNQTATGTYHVMVA